MKKTNTEIQKFMMKGGRNALIMYLCSALNFGTLFAKIGFSSMCFFRYLFNYFCRFKQIIYFNDSWKKACDCIACL